MQTTSVHVFARWKVKEGKLDVVLELLRELSMQTRNEKGNIFYTVHQVKSDSHTLVIFEGYSDEAAQKSHNNSPHFQRLAVGEIIPLLSEREVCITTVLEI